MSRKMASMQYERRRRLLTMPSVVVFHEVEEKGDGLGGLIPATVDVDKLLVGRHSKQRVVAVRSRHWKI